MESEQFDAVVRRWGTATRRTVVGLGLGSGLGGVFALVEAKKKKGKKKRKKKCKAQSTATTCAGKCGNVTNNCKRTVDCGACAPPCQVQPTDDLQAAIDAAQPGSTLRLCAGTWNVTTTVRIEKDLTLIGAGIEQTVLDGGTTVQVLIVSENSTVTLRDLTITRGNADYSYGGGIANSGDLTLRDMAVTSSTSAFGGGIMNWIGTLTLEAGSRVTGNSVTLEFNPAGGGVGGGIFNFNGTLILESGSRVTGNTAEFSGGGISGSTANTVTLEPGSTVTGNMPDNCHPDNGTCL